MAEVSEERVRALEQRVSWLEAQLTSFLDAGALPLYAPAAAPAPAAPAVPPPPQTGLAIMVDGERRGFLPYAAPPDAEETAELTDWVRLQEEFGETATLEWHAPEEETEDGKAGQAP